MVDATVPDICAVYSSRSFTSIRERESCPRVSLRRLRHSLLLTSDSESPKKMGCQGENTPPTVWVGSGRLEHPTGKYLGYRI